MPTSNRTFTFASNLEGWVAGGATHANLVLSRTTAEGQADGACLQARLTGKNNNPGQSWWEWTGTWEDLGVTPGDVVTQINGAGSFWTRCSEFNTGHANNNVSGPLEVRDAAGNLIGTLSIGGAEISGTSAWSQVPSTAVPIPDHASNTTIRLRLNVQARTGSSNSAAVTIRQDTIHLETTHDSPGTSIERTVTDGLGITDETDGQVQEVPPVLLLRAHTYSGSGDWLDESGNGHDAELIGSPTWQGNHFTYNGDAFEVAASPDFAAGTGSLTMLWVGEVGAFDQSVISTFDPVITGEWALLVSEVVNPANAQFSAFVNQGPTEITAASEQPYTLDSLIRVAFVLDRGAALLRLYIDGVQQATAAIPGGFNQTEVGSMSFPATGSSNKQGAVYGVAVVPAPLDAAALDELADSIIGGDDFSRTITDDLGLTDTGAWSGVSSDKLGLTDTIDVATTGALFRTVTDDLGLTDDVSVLSEGVNDRTITDPLGITDAGDWSAAGDRDRLGLTDSLVVQLDTAGLSQTIVDPLGLTDEGSAEPGAVGDPLGLSDSVSVVVESDSNRVIIDSLGITDDGDWDGTAPDRLGITDSVVVVTAASVAVAAAIESENAEAIAILAGTTSVAVGAALEVEVSRPVDSSQDGEPQFREVEFATESEAAQPVDFTSTVTQAVAAATELEAGQPVAVLPVTNVPVGFAVESEAAEPVTSSQATTVPVGAASEDETAETVTVVAATSVAVAEAIEAETVEAVSTIAGAATVAVSAALETEQARIVGANQASAPQSRPVDPASEIEAGVAVGFTSTVTQTVTATSETELAQVVDSALLTTITVGAAAESEAAQAITPASTATVAVTEATETELARAIALAAVTSINVDTATESELAGIVGIALGLPAALETEQARIVGTSQAGAPQSRPVDPASEIEAAQTVSIQTTVTVTVPFAAETEAAEAISTQTLTSIQVVAALESEAAGTITPATVVTIPVASGIESEAASQVTVVAGGAPQSQAVTAVTESENAQPVSGQTQTSILVTAVVETEEANLISLALGIPHALETEEARIIGAVQAGAPQSRPVDFAPESEVAQVVNGFSAQSISVDPASELEAAQPIDANLQTSVSVSAASEVEEVTAVTILAGATSIAVAFATESDQANPVSVAAVFLAAIGVVTESELATGIGLVQGAASISVSAATETELAQVVIVDDGIVGVIGGLRDPELDERTPELGERTPLLTGRSVTPL